MSLAHGAPIEAEEVERMVSRQFTPRRFAALCNSISWALSGERCKTLPSFTERVNAKDGGIDAEWQVELPDTGDYRTPFLGSGWNVFQYKQRDMFAQGREKTFSSLAGDLKGALDDLKRRTGRAPDRYILFTNLDLTHFTTGQKGNLKKKILAGFRGAGQPKVEIVGAAELAAFLNSAPAIRSAFFATAQFETWEQAQQRFGKVTLYGANTPLVGREGEFLRLQSLLHDPAVRSIVLTGPQGIGKTRLALEAASTRPIETVVAFDAESLAVRDLLALEIPRKEVLVIIEDPPPGRAADYARQALAQDRLKLLITLPVAEGVSLPNFGQDGRIQVVPLGPLSDSAAHDLLKAAGAKLDYGVESWIIDQAGGNPNVLLFAASVGAQLRETSATFIEKVARTFEQRAANSLGADSVRTLRVLSVLTHMGTAGKQQRELELACELFGEGMSVNSVLNTLARLEHAGLILVRGEYTEVVPPLFASWLASAALQARFAELVAFFGQLSQAGRLRLARRLSTLTTEEASRFWETLFGTDGPLKDLPTALEYSHFLRLVAVVLPERVAERIEGALSGLSLDERLGIKADRRRELMWTLEALLFRRETSSRALRCLALLAEAENEHYGNNATGVLCEVFHPLHQQMPLPLSDRLAFLRELLDPQAPAAKQLLGVKAVQDALRRVGGIALRRSEGARPLDAPPSTTYGEAWDYIENLAGLLIDAAQSDQPEVAQAAREALPHVLAESAIQARPEAALARFKTAVEWATSGQILLPVDHLADALGLLKDVFADRKNEATGEIAERSDRVIREIATLIDALEQSAFATRLRRWTGRWGREGLETVEENGQQVRRDEREIRLLAQEAVTRPELLNEDLLAWLCSSDAHKAHAFFWCLGALDTEQLWRPRIEQAGAEPNGVGAFASYFGALAQSDRAFVSQRLDELAALGQVTGEAIVSATASLGGDDAGILRVETLLAQGRVESPFTSRRLGFGGWTQSITSDQYLRLLTAIAGPQLEYAAPVIDSLGMWIHSQRTIDGHLAEFAWQCLESAPPVTDGEAYDCDRLAAHLAPAHPDRAFRLLETLLTQPYEKKSWNSLQSHREHRFWSILLELNRERALRLVLSLALHDPTAEFHITWNLRELLDQERDADILFSLATEDEGLAELLASTLTAARPGFWPLGFRFLTRYPRNKRIQGRLAAGAEHSGSVISGPFSAHYEQCRQEVERLLNDPSTPRAVGPWLRVVEQSFQRQVAREVLTESEEEVNELRRIRQNPTDSERLWAINTLLRLGRIEDALGLLTPDEMERLLRKRLPKKTKQSLRKKLKGDGP